MQSDLRAGLRMAGLTLTTTLVLAGLLAALTPWDDFHPRGPGNATAAIGALKTIGAAQSLFQEGDKDRDKSLDYAANLSELSDQSLIDSVLGSGAKQGYVFWVTHSPATPELLWAATAEPECPGETGDRYFATNHQGVIFYTTTGPIPIDPRTCAIPPGPAEVGK